jgi:hypothetical protein
MIDFAHSFALDEEGKSLIPPLSEEEDGIISGGTEGPDLGYIHGLRSLLQCFNTILASS